MERRRHPHGEKRFVSEAGASRRHGRGAAPISPRAFQAFARIEARFGIEREIHGEGVGRFLGDGRVYLTDNTAEWAPRGIALGRTAWLFAGFDRVAERAAVGDGRIGAARLTDIGPQIRPAGVLARIADISQNRLHELVRRNRHAAREPGSFAARALSIGSPA